MSEYVHDVAVHIDQILGEMVEKRRIVPSRLQRAISLLERGATRARVRRDQHLLTVFDHCLTALNRQPLHQLTDRQLETIMRLMRLVADGGRIESDDTALAVELLTGVGLSVGAR